MSAGNEVDTALVRQAFDALLSGDVHTSLTCLSEFFKTHPQLRVKAFAEEVDQARDLICADYYKDVGSLADALATQWRAGEFDGDRDNFMRVIDETVEGAHRVIYTAESILGLYASDNDDAYFDETGEKTLDCKSGMPWMQLIYYAMRVDVIKRLDYLDIDVNVDPPREGEIECEECNEWAQGKAGGTVCDDCRPGDGRGPEPEPPDETA